MKTHRSDQAAPGDIRGRNGAEKKGGNRRLKSMSNASSQIVKQAAQLLDAEIAAGVIAARKVQRRLDAERNVDPADLKEVLQRFQSNGHEVVTLLNEQLEDLKSDENGALVGRLVSHTHDLLDLLVGFVNLGTEVAGQLAQANLPKKNGQ